MNMKFFTTCSLLLFALVQLSSADAVVLEDKRYGIYNLIATKVNEQISNELVAQGQLCSKMWRKLNALVGDSKDGHSAGYQEIKKNSDQFIEVTEELKADKQNCALQKDALKKYEALWYMQKSTDDIPEITEAVTDDIVAFFRETYTETLATIQIEFNALLHDIYDELPAEIESFKQSLDDNEKLDNKKLLQWGQQFVEAKDEFRKMSIFSLFSSFALNRNRVKGAHCKWDESKFVDFMYKTTTYTLPTLKPTQ